MRVVHREVVALVVAVVGCVLLVTFLGLATVASAGTDDMSRGERPNP